MTSIKKIIGTPVFAKAYGLLSVTVLLATTLFWSIKSANIQSSNADQIVDPYLLEHWDVFHNAFFPGPHTFILKWPVFFLIKFFGYSDAAYAALTVGLVIIAVACLAALIYSIERRLFVFGTLCLALASVLLLVPAEPYPGGLLPVNMAMLATRNLEYVLYIGGLILLVRSRGFRSLGFWLAVVGLSLLVASDKLFLTISLGGALLALPVYTLRRGWQLSSLAARWLALSLLAALGALGTLWLIQAVGLTHVVNQSGNAPFGLTDSPKNIALGIIYAGLGLLTNFGANPGYDATLVRHIPSSFWHGLIGAGGPAYIVNLIVLAVGLFIAWRLVRHTLTFHRLEAAKADRAYLLSAVLIWSALAAMVAFIASNHYYAVDARYLGLAVFALFVSTAAYMSHRPWKPEHMVAVGAVILVGLPFGLLQANHSFAADQTALAGTDKRNSAVAQIISSVKKSHLLVGNYWRVMPIKQMAGDDLSVMPLSDCTTSLTILNSQVWQPDLHKRSFTYLLSLDHGLTNYPVCTLDQIVSAYGRPNASSLVAGSLTNPVELVLYYDHGIHQSAPKRDHPRPPSTVVPIALNDLPVAVCDRPAILSIVAHEDDDLLFMNPDILHELEAGHCVRTVYVTAGDAGTSQPYWYAREHGVEAAYSVMLKTDSLWIQRIVKLPGGQFVTVANPRGNAKVSLTFLHLPDGNLQGQGFAASHFESLARLESGKLGVLHAVDGQSVFSSQQLINALADLMYFFQPTEIKTQSNFVSRRFPDHSDHMAVGRYTKKAYDQYEEKQFENKLAVPIKYYIGYPEQERPPNVSGADLAESQDVFLTYARYDAASCQSVKQCDEASTFGTYLKRQYQNPY